MIITGQRRKIEVKEKLQHSLGPTPWTLSTAEDFLRKTNKAELASYLRKNVQVEDGSPNNSATVFDGMALVQKVSLESAQIAFGSLASSLMGMVLLEGLDSSRINFVSYKENAIKNTERSTRGEVPGV